MIVPVQLSLYALPVIAWQIGLLTWPEVVERHRLLRLWERCGL